MIGSPPRPGSNRPVPSIRSAATSTRVMARIGVARIWIQAVAYSDQVKSGRRPQVIPSALRRWMVVTKLRPVRIDEKPMMKTPSTARETLVPVRALKGT